MLRLQSLLRSQRLFLFLYVLVTLVLWVFVWVHAFSMDITHDEAYSFRLVKTNYFIAMFGTANTHWLNTFFMEIFNMVFGDAPGWLRLHSILAFPFFSLAIYRLGRLIKGLPTQLIFYALVLFNPYVLDFFSLARGYGLALTFQAWSLVYFVKAGQATFKYRAWLLVFILNALTIAANLSYFYTVVGMAGCYAFLLIFKKFSNFTAIPKTAWGIFALYAILLLLTIADLLFIKYYGKDLGYGGDTGFIGSLFGSVWEGSLYGSAYGSLLPVLTYIAFFGMLFACAYYSFRLMRIQKLSTGFMIAIPFISILVLNIVFYVLFKNPFLYGRTALQWYVPGILLICFAMGEWLSLPKHFRWVGTGMATAISLVVAAHFYYHANRYWCFEWMLQANTRQAVYDLYAQSPRHPYVGFSIGGVYQNYYSLLDGQLKPSPKDLPDQYTVSSDPALRQALQQSDYLITWYPVTIQCLQQMGLRYEVLKTYPPGQNMLIKIYH